MRAIRISECLCFGADWIGLADTSGQFDAAK